MSCAISLTKKQSKYPFDVSDFRAPGVSYVGAAQETFKRTHGCSLNFRAQRQRLRLNLSPATHVRGAFFLKIAIAIASCTRQKETFAAEGEQ